MIQSHPRICEVLDNINQDGHNHSERIRLLQENHFPALEIVVDLCYNPDVKYVKMVRGISHFFKTLHKDDFILIEAIKNKTFTHKYKRLTKTLFEDAWPALAMTWKKKNGIIIGNGVSRNDLDLSKLSNLGLTIGCNAIYRDYMPDYIVTIDSTIKEELEQSSYPSDKIIFPIGKQQFIPIDLHWKECFEKEWSGQRPRSTTGINAVLEAIKRDCTDIYCIGFDFLVPKLSLENIYKDTNGYNRKTQPTNNDVSLRYEHMCSIVEKYADIRISFCFPDGYTSCPYEHYCDKIIGTRSITFDLMMEELRFG